MSLSTDSLHPLTLKELVEETEKDLALQEVIELTKNGWPTNTSTLSNSSKGFYNVRHELSYINGILCRGNKYVIPASLYDLIVRFAHEGHLGMTKTKSRIREHYWWPNLNSCVETMIRSCPCCRDTPRDSPVQVPSYVNKPWHQLAIDIKGPVFDAAHRKYFIIVLIDCYSKLAFTRAVPNASTAKIIEFLNSIFSTFGHATILTSDNGPQFISTDFTSFLRRKGIIHRRSSIFNPQSNGVVERFNKNISKLLETVELKNLFHLQELLDTYLLSYNSTQHSSTDLSPCQIIFKHDIKTGLNMISTDDDIVTETGTKIFDRSAAAADYANARRKPKVTCSYKVGDTIVTKKGQTRVITGQTGPYTFRLNNGFSINARNILRRAPDCDNSFLCFGDNLRPAPFARTLPFDTHLPHFCDSPPNTFTPQRSPSPTFSFSRPTRTRNHPSYLNDYFTD